MLTSTSAQIREGFIVDEEEEEEEEVESDAESRHVKRKREHRDREEEERLDEDDLELIGEQFGERPKPESKVRPEHARGDRAARPKIEADIYLVQI